tara:strand:+ start:6190 stop:6723 length:534 start_codon:yes stop_codon:yes gene_type:complete
MFNFYQLEKVIETLFKERVKINENFLKHSIEVLSGKKSQNYSIVKDLIQIINYTTLSNFNAYDLIGPYNAGYYMDGDMAAVRHGEELLEGELTEEWFDANDGHTDYNKRDFLFGLISTYIRDEGRGDEGWKKKGWEGQKEFEEEFLRNPNINKALKDEYEKFLALIKEWNEKQKNIF